MKFKKLMSVYDGKKYIIEEDLPEVGAYLYVYDEDKCIYDCLQNNLKLCQEVAFEEYGVPPDGWKDVDN